MTLNQAYSLIKAATCPEDIFEVNGDPAEDIKRRFRELVQVVHPDRHATKKAKEVATETLKLLNDLHVEAEEKLAAGTFGKRDAVDVRIKLRKVEYHLTRKLKPGDICNVYGGVQVGASEPLVFKVARHPGDNDLVDAERDVLRGIKAKAASLKIEELVKHHLPALVDAFDVVQGTARHRANAFRDLGPGYHSLAEIMEAYPAGIPVQDAAWMFRRLLGALIAIHGAGYVHGAVVPSHVYVCLKDKTEPGAHNGVLIDYCYAVERNSRIICTPHDWVAYYPVDVLQKTPATYGIDLFMASKCFENLIGGLNHAPTQIAGLMRACQLGRAHRLQDAREVFDDFTTALRKAYGSPVFRKFTI